MESKPTWQGEERFRLRTITRGVVMRRQHLVIACSATALLAILVSGVVADEKDKPKQEGSVMGLIIEKKDNMMTVKADGETETVNYYLPDGADKKMVEAFKGLFTVSRVELKYKLNGDKRELTAFRRHIPGNKLTGTITGEVVEIHNKWWIEVKPKDGVVDGFAPGYDTKEKAKAIEEQIKELKKGDIVTIKFTTDFERHRIQQLEKKENE
jgi:hypothetical protein